MVTDYENSISNPNNDGELKSTTIFEEDMSNEDYQKTILHHAYFD